MKRQILLLGAVFCALMSAAEFPLEDFQLRLYSRSGAAVSNILRGSSHRIRRTGTGYEQFWASDRFKVSCRVSGDFPEKFRIRWKIRMLNGIPEGHFLELSCRAEPEWKIRKTGQPEEFLLITPEHNWLCRTEGALMPALTVCGKSGRVRWYWNYDPENINTVDFILTMKSDKFR